MGSSEEATPSPAGEAVKRNQAGQGKGGRGEWAEAAPIPPNGVPERLHVDYESCLTRAIASVGSDVKSPRDGPIVRRIVEGDDMRQLPLAVR